MPEIKEKPADEKFEYFIVRDDRHEYLVKREGGKQTFLLRAENREQVYDVILTDLYAPVYETTPGQMIEAAFGEPQWHYGDGFNPAPQAKRLFPEPPKPEPESQQQEKVKKGKNRGGSLSPYCDVHKCDKYKDGKTNGGKQKYRCPKCKKEEPRNDVTSRKGRRKVALRGNPKCDTCGQRMRVRGQWKGKRYYKCPTCPPKPKEQRDPGEELTTFVRELVIRTNGHDPQLRDDIVQELVTDILAGKLKRKDVENKEIIRRYAHSQERLCQNRHRDVSIDQPRGDDEDGLKLKDVLRG